MNYSPMTPHLSQGSAPTALSDFAVLRADFDVLVLCAAEYQPSGSLFPGIEVIHAPFDDAGDGPDGSDIQTARAAAQAVVSRVRRGKRVLVTCWLGVNRSGLVTALALTDLLGISGAAAVDHVRARRPIALRNPHFVSYLKRVPARQVRAKRRR